MHCLPAVAVLLILGLLCGCVDTATVHEWCYNGDVCGPSAWITKPFGSCNGTRQSPIDISTDRAQTDQNLSQFSFSDYEDKHIMKEIVNTRRTVKVILNDSVEITGGGLQDSYHAIEFHLHWGNLHSVPGSEHKMDGKHFPMELHIVHFKKHYNYTLAMADPTGIAVLGFLIEATDDKDTPLSWKLLTSKLDDISHNVTSAHLNLSLSLDDLLSGVNRSKFYRYPGSLTTPPCQESVLWTIFEEKIHVSKDLIDLFAKRLVHYPKAAVNITNIYRPVQPLNSRTILASPGTKAGPLLTTGNVGGAPRLSVPSTWLLVVTTAGLSFLR
ncbi:carbonic anhydrase 4-like [Polyodon spathula]|uniref:carbonic anhydrase 4-like n=1 Tax=Polyodon spathula TaxID=7913 RepID=UPI001B7E8A54|nr:carbonic anhydrase 4-like [Polyodon spathula]